MSFIRNIGYILAGVFVTVVVLGLGVLIASAVTVLGWIIGAVVAAGFVLFLVKAAFESR